MFFQTRTRRLLSTIGRCVAALAVSIVLLVVGAGGASADTAEPLPSFGGHLLVGSDGSPVIVDLDINNGRTIVHYCNDRPCSSSETVQLDIEPTSAGLTDWSFRIDADGRLFTQRRFGYGNPPHAAQLVVCDQPRCADGSASVASTEFMYRFHVTDDGLLTGIVRPGSAPDRFVKSCSDRLCSNATMQPLDVRGWDIFRIGDEFAAAELNDLTRELTITRCINQCSTTERSTVSIPSSAFVSGPNSSIPILQVFPAQGERLAFVINTYRGPQTYISCADAECSDPQFHTVEHDRQFPEAVNDLGNLVYIENGASEEFTIFTIITCENPTCSQRSSSAPFRRIDRLLLDDQGRPTFASSPYLVTCESRSCDAPPYRPTFRATCQNGQGIADLATGWSVSEWTLRSGQSESTTISKSSVVRMGGRGGSDANGVAGVVGIRAGVEEASAALSYACNGPAVHDASWTCQAGRGRVDVRVASQFAPRSFEVRIGDLAPRSLRITKDVPVNEARAGSGHADHGSLITTATQRPNGPLTVTIVNAATRVEVYSTTFVIDCTEDVAPDREVAIVSSCLAGRGRIDVNIANPDADVHEYRVEVFEVRKNNNGYVGPAVIAIRERTVGAQDWWRLPVTGRATTLHTVYVLRDGEEITSQSFEVACDEGAELLDEPEVQIVNACRGGLGYVLFLFANNAAVAKSWIIEFDGVPNRSTSAAPYGQAVRAVTGRQPGVYTATVSGGRTFDIEIDCSTSVRF